MLGTGLRIGNTGWVGIYETRARPKASEFQNVTLR